MRDGPVLDVSHPQVVFHHPQDAAHLLQIQTLASLRSLSLREKSTSEIPQGRNMQRDIDKIIDHLKLSFHA